MIFRFRVHGVLIPRAAHYIPHGHGPDKEFMASSGVRVGPADKEAPHAAIIGREGRRARHAATLPVVCAVGLRYSCFGPDLIRSPFRVVGATGAGSLFFAITVEGVSPRASTGLASMFWRDARARRRGFAGAMHSPSALR